MPNISGEAIGCAFFIMEGAMSDWKLVGEFTPAPHVVVVASFSYGATRYCDVVYRDEDGHWYPSDSVRVHHVNHPSHWMSLPPEPE